ncbi:MAG: cytochrome c [Vicinamibacteria bacterium]|nr:cytochrome c [Vicinamibacteria bacterium]
MKRTLAVIAMVTLSGAVFAQDPPVAPPQSSPTPAAGDLKKATGPDLGEAAAGEVIYFRYCAACHGRSLKGDGPVAPGLVKKPIDLTVLAKKNDGTFPFDKVSAMIDGRESNRMHGSPDMPVWGEIFALTSGTDAPDAPSAVKRITHFVWSLQEKAPAAETVKK